MARCARDAPAGGGFASRRGSVPSMTPGGALPLGTKQGTAVPGRRRVSRDVWPHLLRAVSWRPIVGAGALALVVSRDGIPPSLVPAVVAAGVAGVLDDGAAVFLGSSPTTLARRRAHRLALALPMASVAWAVVYLAWSSRAGGGVAGWPAGLAFAALVGVVLAASALASGRDGARPGGVAAVPLLLAVVVTGMVVPSELALLVGHGHERNWAVVLAVSLVALVAASRDPAARRCRTKGNR